MNNKDFVSYDVAKLLKCKGYNEWCIAYYDEYGKLLSDGIYDIRNKYHYDIIAAPTFNDVKVWILRKHNFIVDVEYVYNIKNGNGYISYIHDISLRYNGNNYYINEDSIKGNIIYKTYQEAMNEGFINAINLIR